MTLTIIGYGNVGRALSLVLLGSNYEFKLNIMDPDDSNKKGVFPLCPVELSSEELDQLKHSAKVLSEYGVLKRETNCCSRIVNLESTFLTKHQSSIIINMTSWKIETNRNIEALNMR